MPPFRLRKSTARSFDEAYILDAGGLRDGNPTGRSLMIVGSLAGFLTARTLSASQNVAKWVLALIIRSYASVLISRNYFSALCLA
mgnify:CR=1 FL=1